MMIFPRFGCDQLRPYQSLLNCERGTGKQFCVPGKKPREALRLQIGSIGLWRKSRKCSKSLPQMGQIRPEERGKESGKRSFRFNPPMHGMTQADDIIVLPEGQACDRIDIADSAASQNQLKKQIAAQNVLVGIIIARI